MSKLALVVLIGLTIACGGNSNGSRSGAPAAASPSAGLVASGPQLMSGLGGHQHPIATSSPEAQKFFDQGFSLVYAFNHEESVRSFQHAAEHLKGAPADSFYGLAYFSHNLHFLADSHMMQVEERGRHADAGLSVGGAQLQAVSCRLASVLRCLGAAVLGCCGAES